MVYHICNRAIYRGFSSRLNGKKKITTADGKIVRGEWITGQLQEIIVETPPGTPPKPPILCLVTPGKRINRVSDHSVGAGTVAQFTGTMICKEWDSLLKATQSAWLKSHRVEEWVGIPVFEGDIFYHRIEKRFYIVVFDLQKGFFLENMISGGASDNWYFDLLVKRGSLWAPPKEVLQESIQRYHKKRNAEHREAALCLPDIGGL